jgi:hypothetical protein
MFSTRKSSLGLHCSQLVLCAALGFGWSQSAYAKATITTFDLPNSDGTVPIAIQNGVITGYYYFGPAHGFIRFPDGTTTTFDPAGSANTYANSISGSGAVTGYFVDDQLAEHGFVRTPDGNITTFDVPGGVSTEAWWINKKGYNRGTIL